MEGSRRKEIQRKKWRETRKKNFQLVTEWETWNFFKEASDAKFLVNQLRFPSLGYRVCATLREKVVALENQEEEDSSEKQPGEEILEKGNF